jgi:membrane protein DedA with SNARE-associated domain
MHFHGPVLYVVVGLLVFGETAIMLGFVLPGETSALVGGALAGLHEANLAAMVVIVVGAAVVGEVVGYELGKLTGPWLFAHRPLKGRKGVDKATGLMDRHGGAAVFFGRWVAVVRALVPGMAGMSEVPYRTFFLYNLLGGLTWGVTYVVVGDLLGRSFAAAASVTTHVTIAVVVLAVVVAGSYLLWRRHRRAPAGPESPASPD